MDGNGVIATVQPTNEWQTFQVTGTNTHSSLFYVYLRGSGEAFVDDVSLRDTATGTEHVQNGTLDNPLGASNWVPGGDHGGSFREAPIDENTNFVLHLVYAFRQNEHPPRSAFYGTPAPLNTKKLAHSEMTRH